VTHPVLVVSRRRGRAAPIVAAVLALLGAVLLFAESPAERLVGGACAVLFGVASAVLARPRSRTPLLVLDDSGLTDNASGAAAGFVPWAGVTGLVEQRVRGQRYLSVLVSDPAAVLIGVDDGPRAAMRANLALLGTPVNIPLRPLAISVAELTAEFARRTGAALPAALRSRLTTGSQPRPPATEADLAELVKRCAGAGITLPPTYLDLLADQDGWNDGQLRVFGSGSTPGSDGVLEANLEWRALAGPDSGASDHVVLAQDDAHRYVVHIQTVTFHVLARTDHRAIGQLSTFSDLLAAALKDFPHP
jgi:hypothetical protein